MCPVIETAAAIVNAVNIMSEVGAVANGVYRVGEALNEGDLLAVVGNIAATAVGGKLPAVGTIGEIVRASSELGSAANCMFRVGAALNEGDLLKVVNGIATPITRVALPDASGRPHYTMKLPDASGNPGYSMKLPDAMSLKPPEANATKAVDHTEGKRRVEASAGISDGMQKHRPEQSPESLDKLVSDYHNDLLEKSEYPEILCDSVIDKNALEKVSPEVVAEMREEFVEKKSELKREWEEHYGISWPQYTEDIYSQNGKLIRKAGSDYDAHHIQPLCMGGKNVAQNITPMHASVHFDKQGIHAPNSPYSKLEQQLGGK